MFCRLFKSISNNKDLSIFFKHKLILKKSHFQNELESIKYDIHLLKLKMYNLDKNISRLSYLVNSSMLLNSNSLEESTAGYHVFNNEHDIDESYIEEDYTQNFFNTSR